MMSDSREAAGDIARIRWAVIGLPAALFVVLAVATCAAAPGSASDRLLLVLVNGVVLAMFAGLGKAVVARYR